MGLKVVIVGGRLQGVEAAYLAHELGWESVVVDKDENAPASGICTRFVQGDATEEALMTEICHGVDLLLPAIEKQPVLDALERFARPRALPLVYDRGAYAVSSSKLRSDKLFAQLGLPAPAPWPACGYPVLCKPSEGSGSRGVNILRTEREVREALDGADSAEMVLQQYLSGKPYSVEVVGDGETYAALQVTQLFMHRDYDCKRVLAPSGLSPAQEREFCDSALRIAAALGVRGIFDVEAIYSGGKFHILEIDARLPSQTPTAVCHSSGANMLELLLQAHRGALSAPQVREDAPACLYEHVRVKDGVVEPCGEHIMGQLGRLTLVEDFMGADSAIVSDQSKREWAATLIYRGQSRQETLEKHRETFREIRRQTAVRVYK